MGAGEREPGDRPTIALLLRVWLTLGVQSFGGGSATLFLIRREVVERRRWVTDAELTRDWAICQIAPGINLIALTLLIGRRLGGAGGAAVATLGLLLPSVALTVLLTALYAGVQRSPAVQAGLRGVVPATIGLGALLSLKMVRPMLAESRREGRASLLVSLALLAGSAAAMLLLRLPVIVVLLGAGALGAVAAVWSARGKRPQGRRRA